MEKWNSFNNNSWAVSRPFFDKRISTNALKTLKTDDVNVGKCGMWLQWEFPIPIGIFFHLSKKNSNKFNSIIKILFRQNINCSIPFHWNNIRIIGLSYFFHNSSQDKWKYGVVFFRANVREHMDLRHIRSQKFTKRHGNEVSQSKMRRCYATSRCFIHIFIGQVSMYAEWVCRKKGQYA